MEVVLWCCLTFKMQISVIGTIDNSLLGEKVNTILKWSEMKVVQLRLTLCNPMSMGFSKPEYWSG